MALSLQKGGNISLSKTDPSMRVARVGLSWDPRSTAGVEFDLDASALLLSASGRVRGDHDFIFYNQLSSADGTVQHTGDNRSGIGDGDDEVLIVNLAQLSHEIQKILFVVTIHDARARGQNFGQVPSAAIRIVNDETGNEVTRFDLSEDMSTETAMIFGELYRHNGEWKFRAVGQGYAGGLGELARQYGVNV